MLVTKKAPDFTAAAVLANGQIVEDFNLMENWMVDMYHDMGFTIHPYAFDTENDLIYVPLSNGQFTNRTDLLLDYYNRPHKTIENILTDLNY